MDLAHIRALTVPVNDGRCVWVVHLQGALSDVEQGTREPLARVRVTISALLQNTAWGPVEVDSQLLQAGRTMFTGDFPLLIFFFLICANQSCTVGTEQHRWAELQQYTFRKACQN